MKKTIKKTKTTKRGLTDRSRAERVLGNSELRYRRLFETAQDGILILDAKTGAITDVNPHLIALLGYSREEFIEKKLWEVGAFKDIEASKDAFEALQQNEYIRYENLPLKAKDGRLIQVEFVSNVYLVGEEQVIQCNIRDITEHKRLVAALQENEKKYRTLVTSSPDGIFLIDLSGNFISVNQAMCGELGFSEEELRSMNIWGIVPEQYLDEYRTRLTKILNGESLIEPSEYAVRGKDGKILYIEVLSAPYYSEKGIIGFQGIAHAITARKQAEEALRQSEERYRRMLDTMLEGCQIIDFNWRYTYLNDAAARDSRRTKEELLGHTMLEMYPGIESTSMFAELRRCRDERIARRLENEFVYPDGTAGWFDLSLQPMPQGIFILSVDITERKRTEQAMADNEKRFRALIESASDGISLLGADGKIVYASPATQRILGFAPEDLIGIDPRDYTHPDDLGPLLTLLNDLLQKPGSSFTTRYRFRHKDGSWRWLESTVSNLLAESWVKAIVFNYRDVTERTQAEEALRAASTYNRRLIEVSMDPLVTIGPDGKITDVNEATETVTGASRQRLVGDDFANYFTEPDQARAGYQKVLAEGSVRDYPLTIRHTSGKTTAVLYNATVYKNERGGIQGVFAAARDITERKWVEERQRFLNEASGILASSLDYETTLTTIANLVVSRIADWCSVYLVGNKGELRQVALTHNDPEKIKWAKEFQSRYASLPNQNAGVWQVIQSGQATLVPEIADEMLMTQIQDVELRQIIRELGLSATMTVPLTVHGQTLGAITFVAAKLGRRYTLNDLELATDLAQRAAIAVDNARLYRDARRLNEELEQRVIERTAQLEAANTELEAFSYSVSHDLRAPLRAIDGFSRILIEDFAASLPPDLRRYLQIIRTNTLQMGQLIDDLLQFSRLNRQPLNKQAVKPMPVVRDALRTLESEQAAHRPRIIIGELPDCQADPALLKQVWINLLSNAIKYTRKQAAPQIEVGFKQVDGTPAYFVRDNGVGFDMQYADKLFGVFQRLHRSEDFEGTGVGLAIVQRIIERHGGRIWAEAAPDQGATFYFTLA
jgi:PAS domain S-box-containing protein